MSKHVSSGGDATSSQRDAATESLPTSDAVDAAAQRLSQGATGSDGVEDAEDVKNTVDAVDAGTLRAEAPAKDVTQDSAKGSGTARSAAAGNSTADTRLGGAWASPDAQNAATIGVVPSTSAAAKKARKARGPWYRRRAVVGAAGVALLAGSFGAGWGTNELLSSGSQHGQAQQQGGGNGQGMPGGGQGGPGGGGPGGQGGPGAQNGSSKKGSEDSTAKKKAAENSSQNSGSQNSDSSSK